MCEIAKAKANPVAKMTKESHGLRSPRSQGKRIYFLSRDAAWQKYRLDIFEIFSKHYQVSIKILTTGVLEPHIRSRQNVVYQVFRSWLPSAWKISFFPGALAEVAKNSPDVVLALANVSQLTELLGLFLCRIMGIRFVWWTHAYDHVQSHGFLFQRIKNHFVVFLFRQAHGVITFSEEGKNYLLT